GAEGPPSPTRGSQIDLVSWLTSFETFDALCGGGRRPEAVSALLFELALRTIRPAASGRRRRVGPR
ncbi:MAG: hypothetical protein ACREC5_02885, partial [Thermoplasmata archaeon]